MTKQQVSHRTTIILNAPPHDIMPLFTASGERLWVAGWTPEYIYPKTGEPQTGMIWKTTHHDENDSIWVTINYDTVQNSITYIKHTPDKLITRIDIQCNAINNKQTSAHITYTLTAITPNGAANIETFTEAYYTVWIDSWEKALNHYLEYGEMLTHS